MENNFWIIQLREKIGSNQHINSLINKYGIKIYLFGSSLYKIQSADIDILFLYERTISSIKDILIIKKDLCSILENWFHKPIDIILLSFDEEKEINFIQHENARKVI